MSNTKAFILFFLVLSVFIYAAEDQREVLDGAVVISLNRYLHHFEETKVHMEKAGFTHIERFEAIDGVSMGKWFFESLNIYTGSRGQKGCAASHLLVWENFLACSDKEWLFVAEDDMLPHSDFAKLFPQFWQQTPKDFDIVMVGNQMSVTAKDPLIVSVPCFCTHAYIISRTGAKKLLNFYRTIRKDDVNMHIIDIFLINVMCKRFPIDEPFTYYCYNGTKFKDTRNIDNGSIWLDRDTGICFQNMKLESSIHAIEMVGFK